MYVESDVPTYPTHPCGYDGRRHEPHPIPPRTPTGAAETRPIQPRRRPRRRYTMTVTHHRNPIPRCRSQTHPHPHPSRDTTNPTQKALATSQRPCTACASCSTPSCAWTPRSPSSCRRGRTRKVFICLSVRPTAAACPPTSTDQFPLPFLKSTTNTSRDVARRRPGLRAASRPGV